MIKALPCSGCGREPRVIRTSGDEHRIQCDRCDRGVGMPVRNERDVERLIVEWNHTHGEPRVDVIAPPDSAFRDEYKKAARKEHLQQARVMINNAETVDDLRGPLLNLIALLD